MEVLRTPDERFAGLDGWDVEPRWLEWQGLCLAVYDVGPADGPVAWLLHGEPTWAYMYRGVVEQLVAAGWRCVLHDHPGFGRSDKPADDDWYVIERFCEAAAHVLRELDLRDAMLVVHDWGGPIGLRQLADEPGRFSRVVCLNTWLHHEDMAYGDGWRQWRELATAFEPGTGDLPAGDVLALARARPIDDAPALAAAYDAPFPDARFKAGVRRFPWLLPFGRPVEGNAADQQRCHRVLCDLAAGGLPVHLVWPEVDPIFELSWGERWHAMLPGSTLDVIPSTSHFVAEEAPEEVAGAILRRAGR